ncbi:hypothetical protein cypCar_00002508, partial [Cyprinus carpio]
MSSCLVVFLSTSFSLCLCVACQCHSNGSLSELCHQETGQCQCRQHVVGRQCDECMPNCWWDSEAQLCRPCQCSARGSVSQRCDSEGRCICRAGYLGRRCDLMRPPHARRETRRPVQQVPIQHVQRWESRGGCPRGAYRPGTGVNARHDGCTGSVC